MNILTEDKWQNFGKDGKKFEELIGELLQAMFPSEDFSHTKWTHDGGKDFVREFPFIDKEKTIWAECKFHQKPLPIHDVSMTLLMAYIKKIKTIFFFSYSPVNKTFQKYISSYKKKSSKTIKIFAGPSLEELLIKYMDKINFSKYFGSITKPELVENNDVQYKYWLSTSTKRDTLYLNDIIKLEFSAMNLSCKKIPLEVEFSYPSKYNYLQVLNKQFQKQNYRYSLIIPPNEIIGKTIELKIKEYKQKIKIPGIKVKYNGKTCTLKINQSLKCQWLADIPLIGDDYINTLKKWEDFLTMPQNHFGIIVGRSGTGKSRLIKEISIAASCENYREITFDADSTHSLTAFYFFRKLIYEIEDIPEIYKLSHKKISYICERLQSKTTEYEFISRIISNDDINFYTIKDELVSYLVYALNKQDYILILDNIQFYDEIILDVLRSVIESADLQSGTKVIFAANLDYTYKDTIAEGLIKQISWLEHNKPKKYSYHEITGFKEKEAQEYLRICLCYNENSKRYDNFDYENSIAAIIKTYGTNPLFLQNYLICLLQKNIIERTDTSAFYILDCVEFKESMNEMPKKLFDLLSQREEIFKDHLEKCYPDTIDVLLEQYKLFVTFLAFVKWMPIIMIRKLTDIPNDVIDEMKHVGLLKVSKEGLYGFYHQQIEVYYKTRYPYTDLSEKSLKLFVDIASQEYNKELYLETIFLAQYSLNNIQLEIFNQMLKNILSQRIDYDKTYDICRSFSILLRNKIFKVSSSDFVKAYANMTNICINRVGISQTKGIYVDVYDYFIDNYIGLVNNLTEIMQILQEYVRGLLSIHEVDNGFDISKNILNVIQQNFSTHESYIPIQIELYYLQIYAYNIQSKQNLALEISNLCIDLSEKLSTKKYLIQSWFTKGDIYYTYKTSCNNKAEIIKCWNCAWNIYKENNIKKTFSFADTAFYLNLLMRKSLIMLFENDDTNAYKNAEELNSYFDTTQMVYFEIKIRQLYVIIHLYFLQEKSLDANNYNKLESLLKKSIDICAVYGNETLYLDCFHLLAILQRINNKKKFSIDTYKKCFAITQRILEHQNSLERWSYFLFDFVIAMRESNAKSEIPPNLWRLIKDVDLSKNLEQLVTCSKVKFKEYIKSEDPISIPYRSDKHIYFPKI